MRVNLFKYILIFSILISSFAIFSQNNYELSWQRIDGLEKKGLYREALKSVDSLIVLALKDKNSTQVVKANFFQLKYNQYITEDDYILGIFRIEKLIQDSDPETAAILHSVLAEVYYGYYSRNRYKLNDRTAVASDVKLDDIRTWDLERLAKKIIQHYQLSFENSAVLQTKTLNSIPELIEQGGDQLKNGSIYEFLANRAFSFFSSNSFNIDGPAESFTIASPKYFSSNEAFKSIKISTTDSFNLTFYAAEVLQELTVYLLDKKDIEPLFHLQLKRLKWVKNYSILSNKEELYEQAIKNMTIAYKDHTFSGEAWYEVAQSLVNQSNTIDIKLASKSEKEKRFQAAFICKQVIDRAPKSFGASQCRALLSQINTKALSITAESVYMRDKQDKLLLTYKNCKKVFLKIIAYDTDDNQNLEALKKYALKKEAIYEVELNLTGTEDLMSHTVEALLPKMSPGYYMVVLSSEKEMTEDNIGFTYAKFWVSQLTYQTKQKGDVIEVMALCRKTGHPLEDAEIKVKQSEYNRMLRKYVTKTVGTYKTNKNGIAEITGLKKYQSYFYSIKSGDDFFEPKESFYYYPGGKSNTARTEINLFTDRKLYRPGQTIYFKGIVTEFDGKKNALKENYSTSVKFLDANYQEVKTMTVVTNEFGSFEGKFMAPYGVLTGRMTIQTPNGTANVQVEEYKRPKFSAKILPLDGEYQLNDEITVKGFAEAFAGSKISDATVKYRIQRTARFKYWYWWYRPSPSKEVTSGETVSNEKGTFEFNFNAVPDESIDPKTRPIFNYTITVDVVDINGETHSATKTISIGYHSLVLSNSISNLIDNSKSRNFKIMANDLNGESLEANGKYSIHKLQAPTKPLRKRLWASPDQKAWDKAEFRKLFPEDEFENEIDATEWKHAQEVQAGTFSTADKSEIDFKNFDKWSAGQYKFSATTKDKNGVEVEDETYFTVFSPKSKKSIDSEVLKIIPTVKSIKPNQKAQILLSTAEAHLNIYYTIDFKGETIKQEWLHLKNEQISVDFDVKEEHIGNLLFDFIVVKNDRSYKESAIISVTAPEHHLDIALESFRNKLLPGQDEEWALVIKNAQNEKVQSELLATLYDASLDELFTKNSFSLSLPQAYYRNSTWGKPSGFGMVSATNINYKWNSFTQMPYRTAPYLNTFGYHANSYGNYYARESKGVYAYSMDSANELDDGEPMMELDESAKDFKSKGSSKSEAPPAPVMANGEFDKNDDDKTLSTESSPATVQPRSNFNETAFFFPQLHTNEAGEIRIKFTMPESLTKWRFLGLAHSKDLEIGSIEKELVTQKDLMVMPNMPRFFREGDQMTVSTKISNITSEVINGSATIKFIDPITEQDITKQFIERGFEQSFSAGAEGNSQVSWSIRIPDEYTAVKYQIIAKSVKHSDGEENVLPVLSNRMLVTESMPMPISGIGSKTFQFKKLKANNSTTLKHHQLTLEFTSNPAWYALQAMPYMMEYPYECAEQTFTRYYANAIATHVLNSKPKIKAVIDQWRNESPEAFLSNLNKNQELKSLMLQETPWVLNANSESETKQNLAILLDLNRMNSELEKALSKTIKSQSISGGWAWFPCMRDNRYITQHIITGMGHLDVLGISAIKSDRKVRQMVEKGIRFLDQEMVDDFEQLKKYHADTYLKNNHLGYSQIQYLYMRSYFTEIKMNSKTEEAVTYYKNQAEKYWLEFNIYAKGMIGLAAKRMEMNKLADNIFKSLKDNAIIHEEFGMYWKSYSTGYYWYQAPIETQALMIEFFNEMEDLPSVEQLKMWLLKEKQTTHWKTTKQTAEAVYALLLNGIDLLAIDNLVKINIGGKDIKYVKEPSTNPYKVKAEPGTGYFKTKWNAANINSEMATVKVNKTSPGPAWGAMYWQYFEQLDKITYAKTPLKLDKAIYKVVLSSRGEKLESITDESAINIGDKIRVRIELRTDRNLEYVHMKDMRAAGFEPINVISSFKYQGGLGYYQATKDAATNFFFDYIPKGTYVFEYDLRAEQLGDFSNGVATIQCMYAPEFTSHSNGVRVKIKGK